MQEARALQKWMSPSEKEATKEKEGAQSNLGQFKCIRRRGANQQRLSYKLRSNSAQWWGKWFNRISFSLWWFTYSF